MAGKEKKSKSDKLLLPYVEGDELMGQMKDHARKYDRSRDDEKAAGQIKEAERDWLKDRIKLLAITSGHNVDDVDGVYLSRPDEHGKALLFQRVIQNRTSISAARLLELGVSAETISAATTTTPTESWRLDTVNVGVVIEESDN